MGERGEKGQPKRLSEFRLTSPDRALLAEAAKLYGGSVQPWKGQEGQWELYTEKAELPVMVAPMDVSQWYEMWSGGGCQRRCDSESCMVPDKDGMKQVDCLCDPENRECKLTTRLSVFLPEVPGMGVWRLESHGINAAMELPATAELLVSLARDGKYVPATLAIVPREIKKPGQPTKRFLVPELRVGVALRTLITGEKIELPVLPEARAALPEAKPALQAPAPPRNQPAPHANATPPRMDPAPAPQAPPPTSEPSAPVSGPAVMALYQELGGTRDTLLGHMQVLFPDLETYKGVAPEKTKQFGAELFARKCLPGQPGWPLDATVEEEDIFGDQ